MDDPHIIPIFEAGEADGVLFITMRFVRGGDVRSLLDRTGPLPPGRATEIVSQAASALDSAHARGLVHRDVKSANILLDASAGSDRPDHVYVSDFGLTKASLAETGLTMTGQLLGTLDYVAPEQIQGLSVDGRADQYALACTAFELFTGEPPFRRAQPMAVMYAHVTEMPPRLSSQRAGLPAAADEVLNRGLAKRPADRYDSCREFAAALRRACGLAVADSGAVAGSGAFTRPPTEIAAPILSPGASAAAGVATPDASTIAPFGLGSYPGWSPGPPSVSLDDPPTETIDFLVGGQPRPAMDPPAGTYPGRPVLVSRPGRQPTGGSATERRQVSVLVCELAGDTALSEDRDPEEARDLLSGYFSLVRSIVARYGGVVEKFTGDTVTALWGAPVAHEDDAERAVRAGLEIVSAVPSFGAGSGVQLGARAGVATGKAATTESAGEGLVIGERVSAAAHVAAAAISGGCYMDAPTKRLAEHAISFEDAGLHSLKGRPIPERLFRATRVVSGVGGRRHSSVLEAPFVGRSTELRAITDLFHACAERRSPRLVVVSGPPGVGKSRLCRELEKHIDGLGETVLRHSGRCLSYGDGIAFWALAEIVRQRLGIAEDEVADVSAAKFSEGLARYVPEAERDYVGARLSRLLGVEYPCVEQSLPREELFAGWRLFFECLARLGPVVLVIEDAETADDGLLDFLDHLVDWTRGHPIFVLVLTRPELADRRPGFGVGRNRSALSLDPLEHSAMDQLIEALVPALSDDARSSVTARADGIPLFAVETVRSLLDAGTLAAGENGYEVVNELDHLAVPDSLHALLAARLDVLEPAIRSLVGVAAVLGTSFAEDALTAVSGRPEGEVHAGLAALVRRDVFEAYSDPLLGWRTSYRFYHGLFREVAYETLSRRERKARHLAVAIHLRDSFANDGEEVAEIIARHYLDALAAVPDTPDAEANRREALTMLVRAAQRADRAGAKSRAAENYAAAAAALEAVAGGFQPTDGKGELLSAAALWERAARMRGIAATYDRQLRCAAEARRCYLAEGDVRGAARAQAVGARALVSSRRLTEAGKELTEALAVLRPEPDADTVEALAVLADLELFGGGSQGDRLSAELLELCQDLHVDDDLLSGAFTVRGIAHGFANRTREAVSCFREAVRLAEAAESAPRLSYALLNLSDALGGFDPLSAADAARTAAENARWFGAKHLLPISLGNLASALLELGEWDEAAAALEAAIEDDGLGDDEKMRCWKGWLFALRGDGDTATALLAAASGMRTSEVVEDRSILETLEAHTARALGRSAEALAHASNVLTRTTRAQGLSVRAETVRWSWPLAARIAEELGETDTMAELLALLDGRSPDQIPPLLRGERDLVLARAAAGAGQADTDAKFATALTALRTASPYHFAWALLDHAAYLGRTGRTDEIANAVEEVRAIGTRLRCIPLLERANTFTQPLPSPSQLDKGSE